MATYDEIVSLYSQSTKREQTASAISVAARAIVDEPNNTPNHKERTAWASKAANNPFAEADRFLIFVLIDNISLTVSEIQALSDSEIQASVDGLVDFFAVADAV